MSERFTRLFSDAEAKKTKTLCSYSFIRLSTDCPARTESGGCEVSSWLSRFAFEVSSRVGHIMSKIVVLGIDPGIANCGLSVISRSLSTYCLLDSQLVQTTSKVPKADRLLSIYEAAFTLLRDFDCDMMCVEMCFHNKNVSSSQSTGAVIGAVMCAAAAQGVPSG